MDADTPRVVEPPVRRQDVFRALTSLHGSAQDLAWISAVAPPLTSSQALFRRFMDDPTFAGLVSSRDWLGVVKYTKYDVYYSLYWGQVLPDFLDDLKIPSIDKKTLSYISENIFRLQRRRGTVEPKIRELVDLNDYSALASYVLEQLIQLPFPDPDPSVRAFEAEFQGTAHLTFLSTLDGYMKGTIKHGGFILPKASVHSYTIPLVQSSCMGKSMTMAEAAKHRLTVMINVREDLTGGQTTYPPSDPIVRKFLVDQVANMTFEAIESRYISFFCALFRSLQTALFALQPQATANNPLRMLWYEHIAKPTAFANRENFFRKVIELAAAGDMDSQDLKRHASALCRNISMLSQSQDRDRVELVIVIDEAHTLASTIKDDHLQRTYLFVIEHIFKSLKNSPIFVVFLSTNPKIVKLPPGVLHHPSQQSGGNLVFLPPLTEIHGFDIFAEDAQQFLGTQETLNKLCMPQYVCSLGRPIWGAYHRAGQGVHLVRQFAIDKLRGGATDLTRNHRMALLSIRIMLNLDATYYARWYQSRFVEYFMRVISIIPIDRETMATCTPSEPLLAEGAAALMRGFPYFATLSSALNSGVLVHRERGELVMRALLTRAHDLTITTISHYAEPLNDLEFHRPIRLLDLLQTLLVPAAFDILLNTKPVCDNSAKAISVQTAFRNVWVHFSQFVLAGDDGVVKLPLLIQYFFLRGCAVQCCDNRSGVDVVLPTITISSDNSDAPFDEPFTTKSGSATQFRVHYGSEADEVMVPWGLCKDPAEEYITQPMLSLVFELGQETFPSQELAKVNYRSGDTLDPNHNLHYQVTIYGRKALALNEVERRDLAGCLNIIDNFPRSTFPDNRALRNRAPFMVPAELVDSWGKPS